MIEHTLYTENIYSANAKGLLHEKVVAIIGASSGIGREIANVISNSSAKTILIGRNAEALREIKGELNNSEYIVFDIRQIKHMNELFDTLERSFEKIPDILINSAGYLSLSDRTRNFLAVTEPDWDNVFLTNYEAAVALTKRYENVLKENGGKGVIIHISSTDGMAPAQTPYGISKACLNGFIRSRYGVESNFKVLGIAPGPTATRMMDPKMEFKYYRPEHIDRRCGLPQDIANLALLLAAEKVHAANGTIIVCNGGKLI